MTPSAPAEMPGRALEDVVAAAAARCLRASSNIDRNVPLSLLGLDSLAAIELAAELEQTLGCHLPVDLLQEYPDVRSLAVRLRSLREDPPAGGALDPFERMLDDAVLPVDVRPSGPVGAHTDFVCARRILLTGATGFLGAALAREILQRTNAQLLCVARSGNAVAVDDRLRNALSAAGADDAIISARVHAVEGDLSRPEFGLSRAHFEDLARNVDAICHAGAVVNWVYSYAGLRASNVLGTLELLRLACGAGTRCIPLHFVSSLSVCHSTAGPRSVDEDFDVLPHLRGLHLGYAQTKAVAEALVRQAGQRGLPVRIYRPGLISGDSRTGAFNADDLLSTLVRGCVRMRTAPDLDWRLDVQPVDFVSRAIVELSSAPGPVFHLAHDRPRHWREIVLWLRLYGYPIHLVPYHAWLRQLDSEMQQPASAATHPLRGLRSFFLDRPDGARGLTLPELYEDARCAHVTRARTAAALAERSLRCPTLDTTLLDTYFRAFVSSGSLPAPLERTRTMACGDRSASDWQVEPSSFSLDVGFFTRLLPQWTVRDVQPLATGSVHSIVSELAAWRCRRPTGLFRFRLALEGESGRAQRDVFVKIKPRDVDVIAVGEALAAICNADVAASYARCRDRVGLSQGHERELAIYAQQDPRFLRHAPRVLGTCADPSRGLWAIALERIDDAVLLDAVDRPQDWTRRSIGLTIDGLVALQSIWFGREVELRGKPWIGYVHSAGSMAEMADLWMALAHHAAPAFSSWADPTIASIHEKLVSRIEHWWGRLERGPRTLIHNDFNPRNICLRGRRTATRLCAYDWELATPGAPQRDLAELLSFVLPQDVAREEVDYWIERHRSALSRQTGCAIDRREWHEGFRAALGDFLISRLAMYALIHRVRPQRFLPRVVGTWRRLFEQFPLEGGR